MPSRTASGGGRQHFGSFGAGQPSQSIDALEATLRELQMKNDEQAVVQVSAHSLTLTPSPQLDPHPEPTA